MTDIVLLNEYIEKSGLKKSYIAEKLDLTNQGLTNKLQGVREFSVKEILILCKVLKIKKREREKIFFNLDVENSTTS